MDTMVILQTIKKINEMENTTNNEHYVMTLMLKCDFGPFIKNKKYVVETISSNDSQYGIIYIGEQYTINKDIVTIIRCECKDDYFCFSRGTFDFFKQKYIDCAYDEKTNTFVDSYYSYNLQGIHKLHHVRSLYYKRCSKIVTNLNAIYKEKITIKRIKSEILKFFGCKNPIKFPKLKIDKDSFIFDFVYNVWVRVKWVSDNNIGLSNYDVCDFYGKSQLLSPDFAIPRYLNDACKEYDIYNLPTSNLLRPDDEVEFIHENTILTLQLNQLYLPFNFTRYYKINQLRKENRNE